MYTIKEIIRRLYVYLRYNLLSKRVECMSFAEAKYLLGEFHPQKPPRFEQVVNYNPVYDLMIIVPVYNVAPFLENCITSILSQKTKYSYCAVFIDDGSTDGSGTILDRYSTEKNVNVIHKENRGVAGARNYALRNICGRYIMFVDSDDLLSDNAVELLLDAAIMQGTEVIEGGHKEVCHNEVIDIHAHSNSNSIPTELSGYPWGKIIASEKMLNLCFPEGYQYEDTIITTLLLPACKVVTTIPERVYYYRKNANGISATSVKKKESVDTVYLTYYCMEEALRRGNEIIIDNFLKQVRLNWMRTQSMPESIRKASFIVQAKMIDKYFTKVVYNGKKELNATEKTLRKRSFYAYEWLMNNWHFFEN